ncbi:MAG: hypothetical protein M5U26_15315 [Planctomycetota bacterium]|nr:hypothetical protein [Planctomycetota bacterium]
MTTATRASWLTPALFAAALLMLLVPREQVLNLRSQTLSALAPVLRFFQDATRGSGASEGALPPPLAMLASTAPETAAEADAREAEVRRLRAACARLVDENRRLHGQLAGLGLKREPRGGGVLARVLAREGRGAQALWGLDRGAEDGIVPGCGALYDGAAIGRVVSTAPRASCLAPLTHPGIRLAARLLEARAEGVLRGVEDADGTPRCVLSIVAARLEAREGESVVSAGVERAFPPGCLLGAVTAIRKIGEMEWELDVRPVLAGMAVEAVAVYVPAAVDVPWPEPRKK